MPVTINGSGSITGLAVGGLPDGSVDADTLASNAVTTAKLANGAATQTKRTYANDEIIQLKYGTDTSQINLTSNASVSYTHLTLPTKRIV